MMDDLFGLEDADYLDCVLKAHTAKQEARSMAEEDLVDYVVNRSHYIELDFNTDKMIGKYFKKGTLEAKGREALENYYVLFSTTYFLGDDGEIYASIQK